MIKKRNRREVECKIRMSVLSILLSNYQRL